MSARLLNDGHAIPSIGFGTYPLVEAEATTGVSSALDAGYRLVDSAVNYGNEAAVGRAIRESDVPRDEVTLTTKIPGRHHGYDATLRSFDRSAARLGLETIDLYLIHWPNPSVDRYVDTWRAMMHLQSIGRVRSIGVSNFTAAHLLRLGRETGVLPAVNQVELHPYFPQVELRAVHDRLGVATQAWSPLAKLRAIADEPAIVAAAAAHSVSVAQVVLRWHRQIESIPIPKSGDAARRAQNLELDHFTLSTEEVKAITSLGRPDGRLLGFDPDTHEED